MANFPPRIFRHVWFARLILFATFAIVGVIGCTKHKPAAIRPGDPLRRSGDEIVVCGQFFHTGAPVVLWLDPGGYDAYRVERHFSPVEEASWAATTQATQAIKWPNRYNLRELALSKEQIEQVRNGGWPLSLLQEKVDQFVIHYDVCGTSRQCFMVLHDMRNLSVHFMLDLDGTIYQTLDVKERAWHAGSANSRSIGIEIANIGAYATDNAQSPLEQWYKSDSSGAKRVVLPDWMKESGIRTPELIARPARPDAITGQIQGKSLRQYDFTPQQYESLVKLTAALCRVFPRLRCDYPRDRTGQLITSKLSDEQIQAYQGLIGHYHLTTEKIDPGPAFQWDLVINGARKLMVQ